jgi:hypothetical protein
MGLSDNSATHRAKMKLIDVFVWVMPFLDRRKLANGGAKTA